MILTDQGHSVHHYCSDVTTSFPANGVFTQKQKELYDLVLKCNRIVLEKLRPGVNWKDMHLLSEKTMLEGLRDLGLIQGDIDEMQEGRLGFIFMPCGLGHFIGLDGHDVGGYMDDVLPTPKRD
jgi:Xaa-Pro dipeptidase